MENHKLGRAPNFTGACIVMFGVNLAWIMLFIFAVYGLIAAVFIALVLNHWINWLEYRRAQQESALAPLPAEPCNEDY